MLTLSGLHLFQWNFIGAFCLLSEAAASGFTTSADVVTTAAVWPTVSENTFQPCSEKWANP